MAIVTFCGDGNKETGNTAAAIATATYMAIKHNIKILLISTNFNENTTKECFWTDKSKRTIIPGGQNQAAATIQSGIEGLSRLIGSSKIEPRMIKDYTNMILRDRLDVLLGYNGEKKQYRIIQTIYPQLIPVASKYYDMVIVDVDDKLEKQTQDEIVSVADIKVITTNQRIRDIQAVAGKLENNESVDKREIIVAVGRYDGSLKYNAKNITRSILRQKKIVNTVPYNGQYYEAMQEGMVIDLFLKLSQIKNKKDPSYMFIQEVERLTETINERWEEVRMRRGR
ncbi:MAG: hypothetical protein HFJ17_04670 [Clostridia bacterium]|nr:hypothetical protein [Clostridia bacterium]